MFAFCLFLFLLLTLISIFAGPDNDAKAWCDYMNTHPEPKIVIYNRIQVCVHPLLSSLHVVLYMLHYIVLQKCGSSTMQAIFDNISMSEDQTPFDKRNGITLNELLYFIPNSVYKLYFQISTLSYILNAFSFT